MPGLRGGDVLLQYMYFAAAALPQETKGIMGQDPDDKLLIPRCEEVGTSTRLKILANLISHFAACVVPFWLQVF